MPNSHIRDKSLFGQPPLWRVAIDPGACHAQITFEPELIHFADNRRAIDELVSNIAMHLHGLAQRSGMAA